MCLQSSWSIKLSFNLALHLEYNIRNEFSNFKIRSHTYI